MSSKKGFAPVILIFVVVLIVTLALAIMLFLQNGNSGYPDTSPTPEAMMEGEEIPSPEPVSEDTDTETIEEELDATVVGEFEADLNSMEEDASGL